jgi:hypothetical protein
VVRPGAPAYLFVIQIVTGCWRSISSGAAGAESVR